MKMGITHIIRTENHLQPIRKDVEGMERVTDYIHMNREDKRMLNYCCEIYRKTREEILTQGLSILYNRAQVEAELLNLYEEAIEIEWNLQEEEAILEDKREAAYIAAYNERYSELIRNHELSMHEVVTGAANYANMIVNNNVTLRSVK